MLTNLQISNIYRGSIPVNKVMLNGAVVWPTKPVFTFETKETSVITLTAITDNDAIVSDYNNNTIAHAVELGDFPTGYDGPHDPGDFERLRGARNNPTMTITQDLGSNSYNYFGITTAINFDGTVIAGVGGLNELEADDNIPRGRVRVYKANYDNNEYVQLGSYISIDENVNAPTRYPEWDDTQNKYTYTCDLNSFRRYGSGRFKWHIPFFLPNLHLQTRQYSYESFIAYAPKDIRFGIHFDTTIRLDDSGTRIAISAPWAATSSTTTKKAQGLVRVFDYNSENDSWEQVGNDIWGERELAILGMNLQMAGNGTRILVSHQKPRENSSIFDFFQRVYDYDQSSNQWIQKGKDLITTETYQEEIGGYVSSEIAPRRAPYFSYARELTRDPAFNILQLAGNGETIYYSPDVELRFDESRDDWVVVGPIYLGWRPENLDPGEHWSDHYPHIFIMDRSGKAYATHFAEFDYTSYSSTGSNYMEQIVAEFYSAVIDMAAIFIKTDVNAGRAALRWRVNESSWNEGSWSEPLPSGDLPAYGHFEYPHILCDAKITPLYGATMATLADIHDRGDLNPNLYGPYSNGDHEDRGPPRRLPIEWGAFDQWGNRLTPSISTVFRTKLVEHPDVPEYQYNERREIWAPGGRSGDDWDGTYIDEAVSLEIFHSDGIWKDAGETEFVYKNITHYPLQPTTNGCSVQISGDGTTVIAGEAAFDRIHIYKRKPVGDRITSIRSSGKSGSTENNSKYNISGENNRAIAVKHNIVDASIVAFFQIRHAESGTSLYFTGVKDYYLASITLTKITNTTDNDIDISVECNGITHVLTVPPGVSRDSSVAFTGILPGHSPGSVVKKDLVITNLDADVETRAEITLKTYSLRQTFTNSKYEEYVASVGGGGAGSANLSRTINLYSVSHLDVVNNADRPFTLKRDALVAHDSALKAVYFGGQQLESLTIRNHKEFTVMQTDKTGTRSIIYERPDWLTTAQTPLFYTVHGSGVNYTYNI